MKKLITILFILALGGTLLPGVVSFEKGKVVLFSTVEEEQPESGKVVKGKEEVKALFPDMLYSIACSCSPFAYPHLLILLSDDPCLSDHTPPPDSFC
jgi:hypothetical protein